MNTPSSFARAPLRLSLAATLGAMTLAATLSARADTLPDAVTMDAGCQPVLGHRDATVYRQAREGVDSLRRYLAMRQQFQLDLSQAADWADGVSRLRAACLVASAHRTTDTADTAAPVSVAANH